MRLHPPSASLPRAALLSALAIAALAARPAAAEDVVYGPDGAPTVLQHKLYPMSGQWEVGLRLQTALNTPLIVHDGAMIDVSYHPNEWFDAGLELFGNYTALSNLSDVIRASLPPRTSGNTPNVKDEMANADQMRFGGLAVARVAPIYGKLNLFAELPVHFQTYLLLGAGVAQLHHESINLCAAAGDSACPQGDFQTTDTITFTGEVGGGFRFYLGEKWSISAELRAFLFPAQYKAANDLTNPNSGTETGYLGDVVFFSLGVGRLF